MEKWPCGHSGCVERSPRSPDLNALDFFLFRYIKQIMYAILPPWLQKLQNSITDAYVIVSPAMMPCFTMSSVNCSPVSRCVLLLKDAILSVTDRWASFPTRAVLLNTIKQICVLSFSLMYCSKLLTLNKFIIDFFPVPHLIFETKTVNQNFDIRWGCKWYHSVLHGHFTIP